MLAGTCNRYRIKQFKEIKIQSFKQRLRGSLRSRKFYPSIVGTLRLLENGINAIVQVQQRIHLFRIVFVGQAQLVLQIVEAIVHRRCRKHQHLRLHALANDLIQQTLIAIFLAVDIIVKFIGRKIFACGRTAITEIMGFVNHHKVVIAPNNAAQVKAVCAPRITRQIRMVQHVITKTVRNKRIVRLVILEGHPVVVQLLGAKYQHVLVAVFVILDYRKRRESLAKTHAIGENATIVFFQFVDDGKGCIFLEVVKLFPNGTFLETRRRIGQNIFADVIQEFMENIVERYKVNEVGRIFFIDRSNAVHDRLGHFFKLRFVEPTFIELVDIIVRKRGRNPHAKIGNVVAFFYTKAHRRKLVERRIKRVIIGLLYMHERLIVQVGNVRPKFHLLANPLGAFHRNRFLVQLVAQLQFKFATE